MYVDTHHDIFSSEGGITIDDQDEDFVLPMFIAMDPPKHDLQRKTVQPRRGAGQISSILESTIRERVMPDPRWLAARRNRSTGSTRVSIELTTQMLATLFDFPFEERAS